MELLKENYVKYGLIMTGIMALCLVYIEVSGQNEGWDKSPIIMITMMIIPFVVWWLGIAARKKLNKGKLTFKQGLVEGLKISVVYGLTSAVLFGLYYAFVNSEILDYARQAYQMPDASDIMVATVDMIVQVVAAVIFGGIYAAIISFFLKSK